MHVREIMVAHKPASGCPELKFRDARPGFVCSPELKLLDKFLVNGVIMYTRVKIYTAGPIISYFRNVCCIFHVSTSPMHLSPKTLNMICTDINERNDLLPLFVHQLCSIS